MIDNKKLAKLIAEAAEDKKAIDVLILEIKDLTTIADYFIICSADSVNKAQAIANNIEDIAGEHDLVVRHKEGYDKANWILLDFGDVVAHIFLEADRTFYNLEQLWSDAPVV